MKLLLKVISRPGETAGRLWNFRLGDVARWHDSAESELHSLCGPPGLKFPSTSWNSNLKSPPAAFSTRRRTRKPPGPGPSNALTRQTRLRAYDRGWLNPVPGREPTTTTHRTLYCCRTSPTLPEAGEITTVHQPGRPGQPDGPDSGLGSTPPSANLLVGICRYVDCRYVKPVGIM